MNQKLADEFSHLDFYWDWDGDWTREEFESIPTWLSVSDADIDSEMLFVDSMNWEGNESDQGEYGQR